MLCAHMRTYTTEHFTNLSIASLLDSHPSRYVSLQVKT